MSYITTQGVFSSNLPASGSTGTLTSNYILSDASQSIITDVSSGASGKGLIVMPFIPRMYADASGTVGVLKQTTVQILDIDRIFNVNTTVADAKKILKAFQVVDIDASGSLYDPSANVSVSLISGEQTDFVSTLAQLIKDSSDGSVTLADWLKTETQADVTKLLSFDTLANLLEASVLTTFQIDLDASGGADNMWTAIGAEGADASARRRTLFTQFSEAHVEKYAYTSPDGLDSSNERVRVMNFLPFVQGDKFAMVFDVVVGEYAMGSNTAPTSGAVITRVTGDYAAGQEAPYSGDAYVIGGLVESSFHNGNLLIKKPTLRRIAVQLALGAKDEITPGAAFDFSTGGNIQEGFVLSLTA